MCIYQEQEAKILAKPTSPTCDCAEALFSRELGHRAANALQQAIAAVHLTRRAGPTHLDAAAAQLAGIVELNRLLAGSGTLVDLAGVLEELCEAVLRSFGADGVSVAVTADALLVDAGLVRPLLMTVAELVGNSVKHAFPEGRGWIRVVVHSDGDGTELLVEDDGRCGGWSRAGGQGRGIIDALIHRMGGEIGRAITPGGSSCIAISLPCLAAAATSVAGTA